MTWPVGPTSQGTGALVGRGTVGDTRRERLSPPPRATASSKLTHTAFLSNLLTVEVETTEQRRLKGRSYRMRAHRARVENLRKGVIAATKA